MAVGVAGARHRRHRRRLDLARQGAAKLLAATVERADARTLEATDEGDLAARDAYASALRVEPHARKYFAMVALADARLAADQGEDTDAAAWAMLKRAERERSATRPSDPRADREMRQARALTGARARRGLHRHRRRAEDGDIAARCALQRGDVDGARKILGADRQRRRRRQERARAARARLARARRRRSRRRRRPPTARCSRSYPQHPRALVGRALVALERNETPAVELPPGGSGRRPKAGSTSPPA